MNGSGCDRQRHVIERPHTSELLGDAAEPDMRGLLARHYDSSAEVRSFHHSRKSLQRPSSLRTTMKMPSRSMRRSSPTSNEQAQCATSPDATLPSASAEKRTS